MEVSMPSKQADHRQELGIDQLWEALTRLPAKEVIKSVSSISNTTHSFLFEPFFLETQSVRSSDSDFGFFLHPETACGSTDRLELHSLPSASAFGIPNDSLSFLRRNGRLMSSSQGLVLLIGADNELLICNPVTKTWAPLPVPEWLQPHEIAGRGILMECHPRNLETDGNFATEYTVAVPVWVKVDDDSWGYEIQLAIFRNGMWDRQLCNLTIEGRDLDLGTPVAIFRGCELTIHYLCRGLPNAQRTPVYEEPYIAAYNTRQKALSKTFKLPEGAWDEYQAHHRLKIFKWRSSSDGETVGLVRVDDDNIAVWVLDYKHGVWRTVLEKTAVEMGVSEEEGGFLVGFYVVNSRVLVFATKWRVYMYEMEGANAGRLEVIADQDGSTSRAAFTAYANTLRPVSTGRDTSLVAF